MSLYDYKESRRLEIQGYPFYAIIMAAYRQADTLNQEIIEGSWPRVVAELKARYDAPGGLLESDREKVHDSERNRDGECAVCGEREMHAIKCATFLRRKG